MIEPPPAVPEKKWKPVCRIDLVWVEPDRQEAFCGMCGHGLKDWSEEIFVIRCENCLAYNEYNLDVSYD